VSSLPEAMSAAMFEAEDGKEAQLMEQAARRIAQCRIIVGSAVIPKWTTTEDIDVIPKLG